MEVFKSRTSALDQMFMNPVKGLRAKSPETKAGEIIEKYNAESVGVTKKIELFIEVVVLKN